MISLTKGLLKQKDSILAKCDNFEHEGSGWTIDQIEYIILSFNMYNPIKGSGFIPLPKSIADKKCVINVKSSDNKCFLYACLVKNHEPQEHKDKV